MNGNATAEFDRLKALIFDLLEVKTGTERVISYLFKREVERAMV